MSFRSKVRTSTITRVVENPPGTGVHSRNIIPAVLGPGVLAKVSQHLRTKGIRPALGEIVLVEKKWTAPEGWSKFICRNKAGETVWIPDHSLQICGPEDGGHVPGDEWFEASVSDAVPMIFIWMGVTQSGGAYRVVTLHDATSHMIPKSASKLPKGETRRVNEACTIYVQQWYLDKHPELLPRSTNTNG